MKQRRKLVWHGMILFVFALGFWMKTALSGFPEPLMALDTVPMLAGVLLLLLGLTWSEMAMSKRLASFAMWFLVLGAYAGLAAMAVGEVLPAPALNADGSPADGLDIGALLRLSGPRILAAVMGISGALAIFGLRPSAGDRP